MANTWTVESETDESADWTVDDLEHLNSRTERKAWKMKPSALSPNQTSAASGALGWANYDVEDFDFFPEDVDAYPEDLQSDHRDWTIQPDPD